jgi:hypothetical protein
MADQDQRNAQLGLDEICESADQFSAVAGTHAAPLVAHAAAYVALADGITSGGGSV